MFVDARNFVTKSLEVVLGRRHELLHEFPEAIGDVGWETGDVELRNQLNAQTGTADAGTSSWSTVNAPAKRFSRPDAVML